MATFESYPELRVLAVLKVDVVKRPATRLPVPQLGAVIMMPLKSAGDDVRIEDQISARVIFLVSRLDIQNGH